jgi:tripartite-type tricarboxylate transporter receptor subunit TctC
MMLRQTFLASVISGLLVIAVDSHAQERYPSRAITIVVPFGAGSGTDSITRTIAERMSVGLGVPLVIDNKAGANGQIGAESVARAKADGYTLLVATNSTHSGNPFLFKSLRYDPVMSFAPIGRMTIAPLALLVPENSTFRTVQDVVDFARAQPGKLSYGYGNTGGQVSGAMFVKMAGITATAVPYKTTPQVMTDLISGQVDFTFIDIAASLPLVQGKKLRPIGVTSPMRFNGLPQIPALRETRGLEEFALVSWLGLMAPAGTPAPIVARLNSELRAALQDQQVKERLEQRAGSSAGPTTVPEFTAFLDEQRAIWKRRIAEAGIQPE